MKTPLLSRRRGLTLMEVMVSVGITSLLLATFVTVIISQEKYFYGANDYADALNKAQRVADYMARDIRRASSAAVSGAANQTLTLTLPDRYAAYDSQGNPSSSIVSGSWNGTAMVYIGTRTVTYTVSGNNILRQQTGAADLVIADNAPDFKMVFTKGTNSVNYQISFASKLNWARSNTAANPGGVISETVTMRNAN